MRALLELARRAEEGPIRIDVIARRQKIPRNFLANLLVQLKRGRFVQSKKGPEGGYSLARTARQIPVGEVVRYIDGPIGPIQCLNRPAVRACELIEGCGFFPLWKKVHDAVASIIDETTIADVLEEQRRSEAAREKVLMYHI